MSFCSDGLAIGRSVLRKLLDLELQLLELKLQFAAAAAEGKAHKVETLSAR